MEYTELTTDEQEQILAQRVKQYEGEHFNHAFNVELLEASFPEGTEPPEDIKAAIKAAKDAMKTLDKAHAATKAKLGKIKG